MNVLLLTGAPRSDRIKLFITDRVDSLVVYDKPLTLEYCQTKKIDFMVLHGYAPIIKTPVVSAYRYKIVNLHNTFLPWGRGLMGNVWSFFEDTPKGVSLHFVDTGVDSGKIIAREQVELSMDLTLKSSWTRLMDRLERLFMDQWERIVSGNCEPVPQDSLGNAGSFHNRRLSNQLLSIVGRDWNTPVKRIFELGLEYRRDPAAFEAKYGVILDPASRQTDWS
jgi:folate-dependent phosphoribosylglycinamide formyltransferase PurN